mmetsp:Transcript_8363/g.19707  ORF Transcript_8363/g.19707 Transcript_8363/m.19707 type:complete len:485 (-) Transcript_8363:8-1462(-)
MLQVPSANFASLRPWQPTACCSLPAEVRKQGSEVVASGTQRLRQGVCVGLLTILPCQLRYRRCVRRKVAGHRFRRHVLYAETSAPAELRENSTDTSSEEFLQWASSVGIEVTPKVKIAPAAGLIRRRVLATAPIAPGEVLVVLPSAATIAVDAAGDSVPPPELAGLSSWWAAFPRSTFQIAALLTAQRDRFEPYISMLPELEAVEAPWRWPEEHLTYLSDQVAAAARAKRTALEEAWQNLNDIGWGDKVPKDMFFRAQHAAASRAFTGEAAPTTLELGLVGGAAAVICAIAAVFGGLLDVDAAAVLACVGLISGLVWSATTGSASRVLTYLPVIDQVNHQSGPPPDLDLDPGTEVWQLKASQAYGVGDEVVFSYGDKDNDNLLLQHGFVEEDNPFDNVTLSSPDGASVRLARGGEAALVSSSGKASDLEQVIRAVLQGADSAFNEAEDATIMTVVKPQQRAELIVQWRRERRRLLLEAQARWMT